MITRVTQLVRTYVVTTVLTSTSTASTSVVVMQESVQRAVAAGIHSLVGQEGLVTL
ncbi:MAG TPA: hypothetical protein VIZ70_02950 [Propionibacteriaceae bacterium]